MTKKLKIHWGNFWKYRFLLKELVRKNVRLQYRNSSLGMLWSLVQPLLFSLVLGFVFSTLLGGNDPDGIPRILYILSGRLLYSFFSESTQGAMRSVRQNSGIIKKVYVPKYIYPMSTVFSRFVTFGFSLVILVGFIVYFNIKDGYSYGLHLRVFFAVVPIMILLVLSMGVGLLLSSISVFFKDTEFIYSVLCQLLFYVSPVIFSIDDIRFGGSTPAGDLLTTILRINPLYGILKMFRTAIFTSPDMDVPFFYSTGQLFGTAAVAAAVLLLSAFIFHRQQNKFILHI